MDNIRQKIVDAIKVELVKIKKENDFESDAGGSVHEHRERPWDVNAGEMPGLEIRDMEEEVIETIMRANQTLYRKSMSFRVFIISEIDMEKVRKIIADVYKAMKVFYDTHQPQGLIDNVEESRNDMVTDRESDKIFGCEIIFNIQYRHQRLEAYQ